MKLAKNFADFCDRAISENIQAVSAILLLQSPAEVSLSSSVLRRDLRVNGA